MRPKGTRKKHFLKEIKSETTSNIGMDVQMTTVEMFTLSLDDLYKILGNIVPEAFIIFHIADNFSRHPVSAALLHM